MRRKASREAGTWFSRFAKAAIGSQTNCAFYTYSRSRRVCKTYRRRAFRRRHKLNYHTKKGSEVLTCARVVAHATNARSGKTSLQVPLRISKNT